MKRDGPIDDDQLHLRRVMARRVHDFESWTEWSVHCPRRGRVGLEVCASCAMCDGIVVREGRPPTLVACRFRPAGAREPGLQLAADREPPAASARVATLISGECIRLAAELELERVTTLFLARNIECAVVVDSAGHAIGRLSTREILRWHWRRAELERTVGDVMHPVELILVEDMAIEEAASLFSDRRVDWALVATRSGHALGWLSALDVTSWLLRERLARR